MSEWVAEVCQHVCKCVDPCMRARDSKLIVDRGRSSVECNNV